MKKHLIIFAITMGSASCTPELTFPARVVAIVEMEDYCFYETEHATGKNRPNYAFFTDDCNAHQIGDLLDSVGAEYVAPMVEPKSLR